MCENSYYKNHPIANYVKGVSAGVFKAQFEPIYKSADYRVAVSGGMSELGEITEARQNAINGIKSKLQKVLPMNVDTNGEVLEAAFAISSRIIQGFDHRPGVRF